MSDSSAPRQLSAGYDHPRIATPQQQTASSSTNKADERSSSSSSSSSSRSDQSASRGQFQKLSLSQRLTKDSDESVVESGTVATGHQQQQQQQPEFDENNLLSPSQRCLDAGAPRPGLAASKQSSSGGLAPWPPLLHTYYANSGLLGSPNLGNTCYFNAAAAALSAVPPIALAFTECGSALHGPVAAASARYQARVDDYLAQLQELQAHRSAKAAAARAREAKARSLDISSRSARPGEGGLSVTSSGTITVAESQSPSSSPASERQPAPPSYELCVKEAESKLSYSQWLALTYSRWLGWAYCHAYAPPAAAAAASQDEEEGVAVSSGSLASFTAGASTVTTSGRKASAPTTSSADSTSRSSFQPPSPPFALAQPNSLLRALRLANPLFNNWAQHDSHEAVRTLLQELHTGTAVDVPLGLAVGSSSSSSRSPSSERVAARGHHGRGAGSSGGGTPAVGSHFDVVEAPLPSSSAVGPAAVSEPAAAAAARRASGLKRPHSSEALHQQQQTSLGSGSGSNSSPPHAGAAAVAVPARRSDISPLSGSSSATTVTSSSSASSASSRPWLHSGPYTGPDVVSRSPISDHLQGMVSGEAMKCWRSGQSHAHFFASKATLASFACCFNV